MVPNYDFSPKIPIFYQKGPKFSIFSTKIIIFEHFQLRNKHFVKKFSPAALIFFLNSFKDFNKKFSRLSARKIIRGDQGVFVVNLKKKS
jgi:hypothetical protein